METRLIDANALKVNFDDLMVFGVVDTDGRTTPMVSHRDVAELIEWMPTVDAVPVKRGHWKTTEATVDSGMTTCSYCHKEFYIDDLVEVGNEDGYCEFCPNCGAKMDGCDHNE